jgi:hypothetical protein
VEGLGGKSEHTKTRLWSRRKRKESAKSLTPEQARPGTQVRVMEHHRVEGCRGLVGTVVARYGGEDYMAVDMRLADGQLRLFWPRDLEEISPRTLGGASCSVVIVGLNSGSYSPECVEGDFSEVRTRLRELASCLWWKRMPRFSSSGRKEQRRD